MSKRVMTCPVPKPAEILHGEMHLLPIDIRASPSLHSNLLPLLRRSFLLGVEKDRIRIASHAGEIYCGCVYFELCRCPLVGEVRWLQLAVRQHYHSIRKSNSTSFAPFDFISRELSRLGEHHES